MDDTEIEWNLLDLFFANALDITELKKYPSLYTDLMPTIPDILELYNTNNASESSFFLLK